MNVKLASSSIGKKYSWSMMYLDKLGWDNLVGSHSFSWVQLFKIWRTYVGRKHILHHPLDRIYPLLS